MTLKRPLRLLVSGRDAGASDALAPVLLQTARDDRFTVHLHASDPARARLAAHGLPSEAVALPAAATADSAEADALVAAARTAIDRVRPDVILTGLSGLDAGFDEGLHVAAAGRVPTAALQDFWGDVNPIFPRKADLYMVADAAAATLTRARAPDAATEVVGFSRYARYRDLDPDALRAGTRAALGLAADRPLVTLLSQPLWFLEGYAPMMRAALEAVSAVAPRAALLLRPHPRDPADTITALRVAAADLGLDVVPPGAVAGIDQTLAASDINLSCYSTTGLDHSFLLLNAARPAGVPVYLLQAPDVAGYFRDYTGLADMPPSPLGMSLTVGEDCPIAPTLEIALRAETRQAVWEACRRGLTRPDDTVARILTTLQTLGKAHGS